MTLILVDQADRSLLWSLVTLGKPLASPTQLCPRRAIKRLKCCSSQTL